MCYDVIGESLASIVESPCSDHRETLGPIFLFQKRLWKCENNQSLGELWVGLLKFYAVNFDAAKNIVCIRQSKPLTRKEKKWMGKRIGIEGALVSEILFFVFVIDKIRGVFVSMFVERNKVQISRSMVRILRQTCSARSFRAEEAQCRQVGQPLAHLRVHRREVSVGLSVLRKSTDEERPSVRAN